jgi:hypothetical protein
VAGELHSARLHLRRWRRTTNDERLYCSLYADADVMRRVGHRSRPQPPMQ